MRTPLFSNFGSIGLTKAPQGFLHVNPAMVTKAVDSLRAMVGQHSQPLGRRPENMANPKFLVLPIHPHYHHHPMVPLIERMMGDFSYVAYNVLEYLFDDVESFLRECDHGFELFQEALDENNDVDRQEIGFRHQIYSQASTEMFLRLFFEEQSAWFHQHLGDPGETRKYWYSYADKRNNSIVVEYESKDKY